MNNKLLITRPEHDDTAHYLSHFSKKALEKAKNIKILDLFRKRANKKDVTDMIKKQKPSLIIFNGHGSEQSIAGYKNEHLIIAAKNESLLKGKITYAISCKSAKILGKKSIDSGAKSYIGYDDDFIFVYDPNSITRPLKDDTASLFLEPSNELILSLIKGNSTKESYSRSQSFFKSSMKKLLSSESKPEDSSMVRYLWWDMTHQVCLGDKKAVF